MAGADLTLLEETGIMGLFRGPLAQLAEQLTLNQRVRGSIPRRLTWPPVRSRQGFLLPRRCPWETTEKVIFLPRRPLRTPSFTRR